MNKLTVKMSVMLILLAFVSVSLFCQTVAQPPANFAEEDAGTANNPYQIATLANLRWLSETPEVWGYSPRCFFIQTADIDMAETQSWNGGQGFNPIGNSDNRFHGYYNGGGFLLSNLYIHRQNMTQPNNSIGFFGDIYYSNIQNIRITGNVTINGIPAGHGGTVAILFGDASFSTVRNCHVEGDVYVAGEYCFIGLLAGAFGFMDGNTIDNCSAVGNITVDCESSYTGLFTGLISMARIENCSVEGNVTIENSEENSMVGLFAGFAMGVMIERCSAQGNINANTPEPIIIGGMVAMLVTGYAPSILNDSYFIGNISTPNGDNIGGLVGIVESGTENYIQVSHCYITSPNPLVNVTKLVGSGHLAGGGWLIDDYREIYVSITNNFWNEETGITCVGVDSLSYWNDETFTTEYTVEGLDTNNTFGLSDNEMKQAYNYINNGWDFTNIWAIDPIINDGYPHFLTEPYLLPMPAVVISPEHGAENEPLELTLQWGPGDGLMATGYKVYFGEENPPPLVHNTIGYFYDVNLDYDTQYYWQIVPYNSNGDALYCPVWTFKTERDPSSESEIVIGSFTNELIGNYPNPFNPETVISFSMGKAGKVKVDIFNVRGQKVRGLVDEYFGAGEHKVVWNATDVASGIYFCCLTTEGFVETKRMILLK